MDLKEALALIKTGQWISLRFITADLDKGTGGKVLELLKCRIAKRKNLLNNPNHAFASPDQQINPRHHVHFTLNMELENGLIRKVHPILIMSVNNQTVL